MKPSEPNWLHGVQAVASARYATAHNSGETVLTYKVWDNGTVSLKMSSWPRAKEAERAFHAQGWETKMGDNDMGQWIHVRSTPDE